MLLKKKKNIALSYILPYIYTKQAQHQLLTANHQTTEIYWKEPDLLADKKYPAIIFLHGIQEDKQN